MNFWSKYHTFQLKLRMIGFQSISNCSSHIKYLQQTKAAWYTIRIVTKTFVILILPCEKSKQIMFALLGRWFSSIWIRFYQEHVLFCGFSFFLTLSTRPFVSFQVDPTHIHPYLLNARTLVYKYTTECNLQLVNACNFSLCITWQS